MISQKGCQEMVYNESGLLRDMEDIQGEEDQDAVLEKCRNGGITLNSLQQNTKEKVIAQIEFFRKKRWEKFNYGPGVHFEIAHKKKPEKQGCSLWEAWIVMAEKNSTK